MTKRFGKIRPNFWKSSQNSCQNQKYKNIFTKAQFLRPKHLQQNPSEHFKYIQQTKFRLWLVAKIVKFCPIWSPWLPLILSIVVCHIFPLRRIKFTTEDTKVKHINIMTIKMIIIMGSIYKSYENAELRGLGFETMWFN